MVLWLTAALSAIALAVAANVRGETERASTNVEDTRAYFAAKGAIQRALLHMQWGEAYYRYPAPSLTLDFPDALVRVDVIPAAAKLNLNSTPPEELNRLLLALGLAEDRALEVTAAILDWRTPVSLDRPGAFDAFYLAQSPSFLPLHTSFMQDEDLLLVKGVTPDLFYGTSLDGSRAGLRDCLSVYGGSALDVNYARRESFIAAGIAPEDAQTIVSSRTLHPILRSEELQPVQESLGPGGGRLRIGGNTVYTLRATARLHQPGGQLSDLRRSVAALVKFYRAGNSQGRSPGAVIERWYDRY